MPYYQLTKFHPEYKLKKAGTRQLNCEFRVRSYAILTLKLCATLRHQQKVLRWTRNKLIDKIQQGVQIEENWYPRV